MKLFAEKLLTDQGLLTNRVVTVEDGRIASIEESTAEKADRRACLLTCGLLDKHEHGAMGFNAARPTEERCREWLTLLARHGVTNVLYTVSTNDPAVMREAVAFAANVMQRQKLGDFPGCRVEGVHLEGPFISTTRSGAMAAEWIQTPSMERFYEIAGDHADIVRAITMAPEVPGAAETARELAKLGVRVQAGHTDATCAQARKAFREDGFTGVTHFYNAARPLNQREPGVLGAALLDDSVNCEAICDFVHVSPEMLQILFRMKTLRRVSLISDSVSTAGLPDGQYGTTIVRDGRNYTLSGGIAGGGQQADTGLRNVLGMGFPLEDAFAMGTSVPADYLGLRDLGHLRVGARACLAAWTKNYHCDFALCDGVPV